LLTGVVAQAYTIRYLCLNSPRLFFYCSNPNSINNPIPNPNPNPIPNPIPNPNPNPNPNK